MKSILFSVAVAFALVPLVRAEDTTITITKVHMCCTSCEKGVTNACKDIDGLKAVASKEDKDIVLTASDKATLQKGVDALTKAGYFGVSSDSDIKFDATTGAKGEEVKTLKVEGIHLCCPKCVKALNAALKNVSGYETNNAVKNAKIVVITGDFKDSDVMDALQKHGLTGKVAAQ